MTDTTSTTHDARPILERARASMPGLAEIEAALSGIEAALSRIDRDGRPEWTPVDAVLPDALAGRPIPDDLGERVLAVRKANEATGARVQALTRLREHLQVHRRDVQVKQVDPALNVLATELHQLLASARPVLGDVDSADAAIKAGRVDEWREACDLGARYTELRAAQLRLAEDALNPDNRADRDVALLVVDHGHVKDADRHDDAVGTDTRHPHIDPQLITTPGAPAIDTRPWNTGDGLADLRFACRRGVQPWVPNIAQLTGARAEFQARKRETARAAAGLPADTEGRSMFETTVYTPRSTHNVRPMLPGDDARRATRIRAGATPATDVRSTTA